MPTWLTYAFVALAVLAGYEIVRAIVVRAVRGRMNQRARGYAERHGVRLDLFKFGGKLLVREELLNDLVVQRGMLAAAQSGERPEDVRRRVETYIDEIVPAFSLAAYYSLGMRLARAAVRAVYKPVIDQESVQRLSSLPRDATAVFLINHRSNFDYVVVGWALARRVAISYAVGEWARVFPLDALFKAFGGFFVRRGFPDPLYHIVLRRYLQLITRRGVTQGIFPEGGLTRDGAMRAPKVGLLDALLQLTTEPGFDRELYFVPVGINYDRVLEDKTLLSELRGREKPPTAGEKLRGALRLLWVVPWGVVTNTIRVATGRLQRHGYVAVAFGQPVKWSELQRELGVTLAGLSDEHRRGVAKQVALALMRRISKVIPATPVALVAEALLDLRECSMSRLAEKIRDLRADLAARGVPTALGEEFEQHRRVRGALEADEDRNRDLARMEGDLIAMEEAERLAQLGVEHLGRRELIRVDGERVSAPKTESGLDVLRYYARSLAVLHEGEVGAGAPAQEEAARRVKAATAKVAAG